MLYFRMLFANAPRRIDVWAVPVCQGKYKTIMHRIHPQNHKDKSLCKVVVEEKVNNFEKEARRPKLIPPFSC